MLHSYVGLVPLGKRTMMHMSSNMGMMGEEDKPATDSIIYPGWFFIVMPLLVLAFLPALIYLSYTLNNLLPTLAMIEDPSLPAYESLSNNPEDAEAPAGGVPTGPVTASIRQSTKMLRTISGFRSLFRGFWCALVASIAMSIAQNFFAVFLPNILVPLVAPLPAIFVTLPLTTAWTHIVMSAPKAVPWYHRLPPMRKTFDALWRPVLVVWVAVGISTGIPTGLLAVFGISKDVDSENPNVGAMGWKITVTAIVGLFLGLGLMVPAHVIFTRIQASLLPVEDEPIVAFDRSFCGNVEPEVVGGKGYASIADVWKTFTRENWMRLIKLYAKVIGVTILAWIVMAAVFVPIWMVALKHSHREPVGGN